MIDPWSETPGFPLRRGLSIRAAARSGHSPPRAGPAAAPEPEPPEVAPFFKDTAPFSEHGKSLEARLEVMPSVITPNELFFVRNNGGSLGIRADDWRLVVEGDAVENPIELSCDEIRSLPPRAQTAYLECAGNHRAMFDRVQGPAASRYSRRWSSNQRRMWATLAIRWLGRAAMLWEAPGMRTSAESIPSSWSA